MNRTPLAAEMTAVLLAVYSGAAAGPAPYPPGRGPTKGSFIYLNPGNGSVYSSQDSCKVRWVFTQSSK
jgi:hypothetical protein